MVAVLCPRNLTSRANGLSGRNSSQERTARFGLQPGRWTAASGLYFVSSKTAFSMKYLELCYCRLMRARTSPGQEASVSHLVHGSSEDMFWSHSSFRDHLLHALEGFAVARRMPDKVIEFASQTSSPVVPSFKSSEGSGICWAFWCTLSIAFLGASSLCCHERSPHETCARIWALLSLQSHCGLAVCFGPQDWKSSWCFWAFCTWEEWRQGSLATSSPCDASGVCRSSCAWWCLSLRAICHEEQECWFRCHQVLLCGHLSYEKSQVWEVRTDAQRQSTPQQCAHHCLWNFLTHGCCGHIATSFVCRRRASFIMLILKNGHPVWHVVLITRVHLVRRLWRGWRTWRAWSRSSSLQHVQGFAVAAARESAKVLEAQTEFFLVQVCSTILLPI